ncbi:MBL fold metallo-hydrolase [Streptomyces sp. HNM0574]|uniref:MBL fold metallo-hydrolase n=1 Tax=Streptomyces sp. HNM0574 TaxID=2714954 RepID=UPI001469FE9D|nr:MBL fold metallo-hydrolase [Streptomyces sp. HNM0574]NLU70758.1 MBL fold metallo-hydrolase [Streptomyces sp. HNM0574]
MKITSFGHATLLIEHAGRRVLVDPWLSQRLDRFWERNPVLPDGLLEILEGGVDHIVLTHHHCDHLHYPSLRRLASVLGVTPGSDPGSRPDVEVLFPHSGYPMFTASGMGHMPIPQTLRRLGFHRFRPLREGDKADLGGLTVRAFPSRVRFPEMSVLFESDTGAVMFCADAVQHPKTWEYFTGPDAPRVDVAFLPAHSIVPRNVLTERKLFTSYEEARSNSIAVFDRYVSTMDARVTVPFACGWRVSSEDAPLDWCNRTMYPFTPVQAVERLRLTGRRGELLPPATVLRLDGKDVEVSTVPGVEVPEDPVTAYRRIELDPGTEIPPFDPATDRCGTQREPSARLAGQLMDGLVGSDVWCQALETGRRYGLHVTDDAGGTESFVLEPASGRVETQQVAPEDRATGRYTEIAGSTLQALLDGDLLYGSSWGLWTSNVAILPAVFHHPRFNARHLDTVLARPAHPSIRN